MTRYLCKKCGKRLNTEELLERWCEFCNSTTTPIEAKAKKVA